MWNSTDGSSDKTGHAVGEIMTPVMTACVSVSMQERGNRVRGFYFPWRKLASRSQTQPMKKHEQFMHPQTTSEKIPRTPITDLHISYVNQYAERNHAIRQTQEASPLVATPTPPISLTSFPFVFASEEECGMLTFILPPLRCHFSPNSQKSPFSVCPPVSRHSPAPLPAHHSHRILNEI